MNNKTSISCHQTGVILALLFLVLKLTSLPSLMYQCNEIGGVISISVFCIYNIAIVGLFIWIKKKYNNKSFFEITSMFIGTILTRIIFFILFAFFILKLLALVDDGFGFVRDIVDEEFEYLNFVFCFFPVICALAYSGIRNLARTCEFFFPFILIGLFLSIAFSFAPINFWGLGSISRFNISCLGRMLTELSFWNGDIFAMLIFIDKINLDKGKIKNIFTPIILISIFLIVAYVIFFSLYQETAILHSNMIFDIIEYSIGTSSGLHMDIFAILVYTMCLFLQGGIYMLAGVVAFKKVFKFENRIFILTAIVITIIIIQFLYLNDYLKYVVFAQKYLTIFSTFVLILCPLLLLIAIILKRRKYEASFK